jgi:hypothetical protein
LARGAREFKPTVDSPIIEYWLDEDGEKVHRSHVGAQSLLYKDSTPTFTHDKTNPSIARPLLYAVLDLPFNETIDLVLSHYDPDERVVQSLTQMAMGKHQYKRNGCDQAFTVQSVMVEREGLGAFWETKANCGKFPERGCVLVLDIGSSTWLYRLVDVQTETILAEDAYRSDGVYALAQSISEDSRLRRYVKSYEGSVPDVSIIMDDIARGDNRYDDSDFSWSSWLDSYRDPWFTKIIREAKTRCSDFLPKVKLIVITGNGSHIVPDAFLNNPMSTAVMTLVVLTSGVYGSV